MISLKAMNDYISDKTKLNQSYDFKKRKLVFITSRQLGILFCTLLSFVVLGGALGTGAALLNNEIDKIFVITSGVSLGFITSLLISYYYCSYIKKQDAEFSKKTLAFRALGIIGSGTLLGWFFITNSSLIKQFNPNSIGNISVLWQNTITGAEVTFAFALLPALIFSIYWIHSTLIHRAEKNEEKDYLCLKPDSNIPQIS